MAEVLNDNLPTVESKPSIIGVFEGECADSTITNENGLDITREVWENVFNSDLYKTAIDLGHYIGYLGHPEDPNCMDFKDACIVMTEGHIDDDGKVYGKFNLVDTPVGRVVKTFIDSGVTFGISVRGAGDIINNSVDPDTFVFRGFDLVTFPAYKDAIPEFTAIAAATDDSSRMKYQKICASVKAELQDIDSCEAIDIIQSQFPEQSETYQDLELRKQALNECPECMYEAEIDPATKIAMLQEQVDGLNEQVDSLVKLYLKSKEDHCNEVAELDSNLAAMKSHEVYMARKLQAVKRICASQNTLSKSIHDKVNEEVNTLKAKNKLMVRANTHLKTKNSKLHDSNLQYVTKINASEELVSKKDLAIEKLQNELDETVIKCNTAISRASNLDDQVKSLQKKITASQKLISEYQDAYAALYSNAVGVDLSDIVVTASTSVRELRDKITGQSGYAPASDDQFAEPQLIDTFDDEDDGSLITM